MTMRSVKYCISLALLFGTACSRGQRQDTAAADRPDAVPRAAAAADSRVDVAARSACIVGDTLLRRLPGTVSHWSPAIAFDSLWNRATTRWACRVAALGVVPAGYEPIDSVLHWLTERGWLDRTTISADGPDGTIRGVRRDGVTCLVEGRWDGGDDADTTYVPSDTLEIHVACTGGMPADTLP
jgi:hypothetical protein